MTHTADHRDLSLFKGRRVAVVGAGQSALESAALLHENGADVQVIARAQGVHWNAPNPAHISALGHIRRPVTNLCEGWRCAFWNNPSAFRLMRRTSGSCKAKTALGPAGSWWLKDRIDGVVDVLTGHRIKKASPEKERRAAALDGPNGHRVDVDHVIAGTGFALDIASAALPARDPEGVDQDHQQPAGGQPGRGDVRPWPVLRGRAHRVSVGPSSRFIAGTHTISEVMTKSMARRARAGKRSAPGKQELAPAQ